MIVPPIVTIEGDDLWVSDSVRAAELEVEPQDVADGIYTAYDSSGRLLRFRAELGSSSCTQVRGIRRALSCICGPPLSVRLEEVEVEPQHASELAATISRFLAAAGVAPQRLQTADLLTLIELVAEKQAL